MSKKIDFLGFTVSDEGLMVQQSKVKAILEIKQPQTVKDVRAFIGVANYYRSFIPDFAKISVPLISLTRNNSDLEWTNDCEHSFQLIKQKLASLPILTFFNEDFDQELHCDASDYGIGVVFVQLEDSDRNIDYNDQNKTKQKKIEKVIAYWRREEIFTKNVSASLKVCVSFRTI